MKNHNSYRELFLRRARRLVYFLRKEYTPEILIKTEMHLLEDAYQKYLQEKSKQ